MSCWRNIVNDCLADVDKDLFKKAVKEMGLDLDENKKIVSAYGHYEKVDAIFIRNNIPISVGVKFDADQKKHAKIIGDFWKTGLDEKTMMDSLTQEYVKLSLLEQLENKMGYTVDSCEMNEEGEYVIEAYCA